MYFDLQFYWRVLNAVYHKKKWQGRNKMLVILILWVPVKYLFNAICFSLDYLFFPALWRQKVIAPVFIIGHARSGSTLLHRMMAADNERFSYFRFWETKCPSLLQKLAVKKLAAFDRRFLGSTIEKYIKAWDEKTFAPFRHIHDMSLWHSEEDQFVMEGAFVSQKWSMDMPIMDKVDIFHVDSFSLSKRRRWMHHYRECIKRQLLFNGSNKTHLSKNPLMSGWVASILETFPDAKIAIVVRNPLECIPSVLKLLEGNWRARGWKKEDYQTSLAQMSDISLETYTHPEKVLNENPATAAMRVDYRRLTQSPADIIKEVYDAFSLTISPAHLEFLQAQEKRETKHRSTFKYNLADYVITEQRIVDELAIFFNKYNWQVNSKHQLRLAWKDMIDALNQARDAIDQPEKMPPPSTERNLAEGYRYLMGLTHAAIERAFHEDPQSPVFRNMLSPITRATIDNADAIYFYAPIEGNQSYRLTANVENSDHWQDTNNIFNGPKAPHYVIFEATWGDLAGDSGSLKELQPGLRTQTGRLDSSSMQVSTDGTLEILIAPERPTGFTGNFLSTLKITKRPHPLDSSIPAERYANYITGRQLFSDWENEHAIHFTLEQISAPAVINNDYSIKKAAEELRRCGELTKNQIHFWNAFWTIPMGTYGERKGSIEGVAFPRNAFNTINAAAGATGGGMSTNLYAGGVFDLTDDEALIITMTVPLKPQYFGIQLANLWGESVEYANHLGSLNAHQMQQDDDGFYRIVIAHQDPGINNWLDTTGHLQGFMAPRWAYSNTPEENDWPAIRADKVAFVDIEKHLPNNTLKVSLSERQQQISIRRTHVNRRFRHF